MYGDTHAPHAPPSTRHSNVTPGSLENSNVGVASSVIPDGPAVIIVSGGVVSAGTPETVTTAVLPVGTTKASSETAVALFGYVPGVEAVAASKVSATLSPGGTVTSTPQSTVVPAPRLGFVIVTPRVVPAR